MTVSSLESNQTDTADREITATRIFDAPRELVFEAFTDPKRIVHWWGPNGFTNTIHSMDVRPGGEWDFIMHGPDGTDYKNRIIDREITPPERMVFINSFSDENGGLSRHPMAPSWPAEMLNTLTLAEHGGKTTLTLRSKAYAATEEERATFKAGHASMTQGFGGTFDQLADYLARS